jgi:hypothetical protein
MPLQPVVPLPNRHAAVRFLSSRYPVEFLKGALLSKDAWKPYPPASDRAAWQALPDSVRKAHIESGEEALRSPWPQVPASVYLQFAKDGNRSNYEDLFFGRRTLLGQLVFAECVEGQGRFIEAIADAIWSICEESTWCLPAHIGVFSSGPGLPDTREPIVDLFAAETAAQLAWTGYLLAPALDAISPLVMERLCREVNARVLTPAMERDDFWWMGFVERLVNNWNPWINSNWLAAALLVEADDARRQATVYKILESLDRFITIYPKDGGCDEGPSYWTRAGASMFDCLELLYSASGGKIDVYGEPLIQEIGRFIYRAHIAGEYYVNFADAPARLVPDPGLVFRYGQRIGDAKMMSFGASLAKETHLQEKGPAAEKFGLSSPGRALPDLFSLEGLAAVEPKPALLRDVWLSEIQVLAARDQEGTSQGLYMAAKGGHNAESHNHNDVGHFIVYRDGRPVLVDAGVETYTRKTFSPQRYEIWTMQSAYHALPTIGGVMQLPGREYAAKDVRCQVNAQTAQLVLDISGAYPAEARLKRWLRTITLYRGQRVEVVEDFALEAAVNEITFSLLTPCRVVEKTFEQTITKEGGRLVLEPANLAGGRQSGAGQVEFDSGKLTVSLEEVSITDERLGGVWGERLTRILFRMERPPLEGRLTFRIQ